MGHRRNVIITINFADSADRFGIFPPQKPRVIRATGAKYTYATVLSCLLVTHLMSLDNELQSRKSSFARGEDRE
jgi:hypothetical protein